MSVEEKEALVQQTIADIKAGYLRVRQLTDPTVRACLVSGNYNKKLRAAALRLLEVGASPWTFVAYAFRMYGHADGTLWPEQLLSPKTVEAFVVDLPTEEMAVRMALVHSARTLRIERSCGRQTEEILLDAKLNIHPTFRYWIGRLNGMTSVMDKYKERAERIMVREPLYKKLLEEAQKSDG